jgi:hypothetical protein
MMLWLPAVRFAATREPMLPSPIIAVFMMATP